MNPLWPEQLAVSKELEARVDAYERNQTGQLSLARAIRELHLRGAAVVGEDYFPAIVKDMARVLDADYVFVGQLPEGDQVVKTISVCAEGEIVDNMTYALADTPCKNVVMQGACVYPSGVAQSFPHDQLLVDMGVEGYVGIPLVDSHGMPSGIIVALYRGPVPDPEFASTLIMFFAARTGAEIERRRREEESRRLEAQLLRTQKLESLGVLAGGLAHDFNNLLSSMLGSADLALLEVPQGHRSCEHLDLIRTAATDAGALCRQLLAYAGKGRFKIVPTNLSSVASEQELLLRSAIAKGAELELKLEPDLPNCNADVAQVKQILLNLVVNASEALPAAGGAVRIRTGWGEFDDAYLATSELERACPPGKYVYIQVSDTGAGMSPEVRASLFDPFFSTKVTGRGLGLAAILGIVKSHAGTIKVSSRPGRGSKFKVLLPVSSDRPPMEDTSSDQGVWQGSGLALLVDDDEHIAVVSSRMLEAIGFDPVVASTGDQALQIFRAQSKDLAVVVLDLTMPGMGGEDVLREMKAIDASVPVVLTSGFNEQDTVQEFVGRGLAGFLQKPARLDDMREALRIAVESH